ncbi:MAG: hypothetical protein GY832_26075 [Chloroflexi bacterium]|nr:hypothetical protein [Chloroflexota bacterium]
MGPTVVSCDACGSTFDTDDGRVPEHDCPGYDYRNVHDPDVDVVCGICYRAFENCICPPRE